MKKGQNIFSQSTSLGLEPGMTCMPSESVTTGLISRYASNVMVTIHALDKLHSPVCLPNYYHSKHVFIGRFHMTKSQTVFAGCSSDIEQQDTA